ncbi:MAG: hypothetical protein WA208_10350, partial [Thermoanaerobaculia bacterium]
MASSLVSGPVTLLAFTLLASAAGDDRLDSPSAPQSNAATAQIVYEDDFQAYGTQANPPGWVDTSVGSSKPAANGLFKTWPDPIDAAKKNVVFGTKQSSGKPDGNKPRIGTFSTLTTKQFAGKGRFEYRGRLLRTDDDARVGLTFFSSYPERDSYYLIGLWKRATGSGLTMQLFAEGGGAPSGTIDSGFTPEVDRWVEFLIRVDDLPGAVQIRARFWAAGTPEPPDFSIDARDTAPGRLTAGRVGIWAAVKGDAYYDAISAKAPIDQTPPALTLTKPADQSVVTVPTVTVSGFADDAVFVTVNGRSASIDAAARTYALANVQLAEGQNELVVIAEDEVGNAATIRAVVTLDTRAPGLAITTPASGSCLDATNVEIRGRVSDRAVSSVRLKLDDGVPVDAVLAADRQSWSTTLPSVAEAKHVLTAEATDDLGHTAVVLAEFRVDRTAPSIEITEAGSPFTAALFNRRVTPLVRVGDADPAASLTITLDGLPHPSGSEIGEGRHQLKVIAVDCAGHSSEKTVDFEVDTEAPSILAITPVDGSTHGTRPAISGTTTADANAITVEPAGGVHPVTNGAFTLTALPLVDGVNDLELIVSDPAGNSSRKRYHLTLDLSVPAVEISLNGSPIAPGTLFNRAIAPEISATEAGATISATLDGAAYAVGTPIAAEGAHTLRATASDAIGHVSEPAIATFTIDLTRPQIVVTAPAASATIEEAQVEVRGTVAGDDVASLTVNGVAAGVASGAFSAIVPLEIGPNAIAVIALDRAGNASTVQIEVTRGSGAPGLVLTAPADGSFTNRRTTLVAGQLLTPAAGARITVNDVEVAVDSSGAFRKVDHPLAEGENVIRAVARNGAAVNEVSVRVVADLTPPRLRILESGQPLADEMRFAERAVLSLDSTDGGAMLPGELLVDNVGVSSPHIVTLAGGHVATAVARDRAGNETRVQRTFFIGSAAA